MNEETNNQQAAGNHQDSFATGNYQDPLAGARNNEPSRKKVNGASTVAATVIAIFLYRLFGVLGALICYGGYWAVFAVINSKMSVAAKVILSIILVIAFIALFFAFLVFSLYLRESLV